MSHTPWTSAKLGALLVFAAAAACSSGGAIEASSATGASTPSNTPAGATRSAGNTSAANAANPTAASSPGAANPAASSGSSGTPTPVTTMESPAQPAQLAPGNGSNGGPGAGAGSPPSGSEMNAPPAAPATNAETCNLAGAASATTPTIWVIGDSTASVYAADLYPRMGWAQPLQDLFAPACATIADRAISGRSSKSFFDEGAWAPVRDALKSGDFVLIQFGHNDEKSEDPLRFTDPFTTFQQYLSTYIDDSLAHGATPLLLTPINRNQWTGAALQDTHGQYPVAMRQLASTRQLALVDATALTKSYFERIGQAATTLLFMDLAVGQFANYPNGNTDNTHLQEGGARTIAQIIFADLARQGLPIARLLKQPASAP
jgi:lysophospholipase L1-like esterase